MEPMNKNIKENITNEDLLLIEQVRSEIFANALPKGNPGVTQQPKENIEILQEDINAKIRKLEEEGQKQVGVDFLKEITGKEITGEDILFERTLDEHANVEEMRREAEKYAKKVVSETSRDVLVDRIKDLGMDPKEIRKKALEKRREEQGLGPKDAKRKKCIFMSMNGKTKVHNIAIGTEKNNAINLIKSGEPSPIICSRLSIGPLSDNTIYIWRDPNRKGKNKRLSKIVGFDICGECLILAEEGDLTIETFIAIEKLL